MTLAKGNIKDQFLLWLDANKHKVMSDLFGCVECKVYDDDDELCSVRKDQIERIEFRWQEPILKKNRSIACVFDFQAEVYFKKMENYPLYFFLTVEPSINDFGKLIKEIKTKKTHVNKSSALGGPHFVLVTKDAGVKEIVESQGIIFYHVSDI